MTFARPSILASCVASALLVGCPLAVEDSYDFADSGPAFGEDGGSPDAASAPPEADPSQYSKTRLDAGVPPCQDGVRNNAETDVDCGGAQCPPCADGRRCSRDTDCKTGHCERRRCEK
jgi:hypothetical protein